MATHMRPDDFLLARIAEDEAAARATIGRDSARVLIESEARRRIVAEYREVRAMGEWTSEFAGGLDFAIRALTLPYVGHPDYRPWA